MTQLCLCGCGRTVKEGNLYIRGHNGRGIPISESTKQKISIGHKGKPNTEEQKRKISKANKGKKHTRSTEYCRKMSVIKSKNPTRLFGSNNPNYKKPRSKETRRKISEGRIGKYCLENHPNWKGGISFEPYCKRFNNKLKEQIRNRDNRTCQLCGCKENGKRHAVHHIHYDKENCYPDLITLCNGCNSKVNFNRERYEHYFINKLNDREMLFWIRTAE